MKSYRMLLQYLLVSLIFMALAACKGSSGYFKDVVDNKTLNSVMVDGIPLQHKGEVSFNESYPSGKLELSEGTTFAELSGTPEKKVNLQVSYLEFQPGDASFRLSGGKILAETKSGNPVAITRISGNIPEKLDLDIELGTGSIKLNNLKGSQNLRLDTGTGSIIISDSDLVKIIADTGTGSVSLKNCRISEAEINTGTGNIILEKSEVANRNFNTGTGKVIEK